MGAELVVDLLDQADLIYDAGHDAQMVDVLHFYTWSLPRFVHGSIKYLNSYSYLRNAGDWLKQQQIDTGKREGLTTDEREELRRLRKENKILKEEREVLRKATAFFAAQENNSRRRR